MAAFKLCLPEMVMGVNKARANALADLGDLIGLDQDISIP